MKRIILFSLFFASFFLATGQNNADFQTVNVRNNFGPPVQDTISAPYKLGEIRTRPQDGRAYRYNGKPTGQRRWDYLYYGPAPSVTPSLDQVLNIGATTSLGFTSGPATLGGLKIPSLGQTGTILMAVVQPNGTFSVLPIPGSGTQITSINTLTAAAQFLKTSMTSATTSPVWGDVTATHTLNIPIANALDTGIVTPANVSSWNGKFTLPGGGNSGQYINGVGGLVTFPTIPDTGHFTGVGIAITGNPAWPNLLFTVTGGGGGGVTGLSGDVAGSGTGTIGTTIQPHVVSYNKMQQAGGAVLLGNPTGSTADISQITLLYGLKFSGTSLYVDSTQYVTTKKLTDSLKVRDSVYTALPVYVQHGTYDTVKVKNDSAAWNAKAIFGVPVNMAALANNFVLSYSSGTNTLVWVAQTGGGGGGTTNLSLQRFADFDTIYSSTGTAARLDTATASLSGAMSRYAFNFTHHTITMRRAKYTAGFSDSLEYAINDTLFFKGLFFGPGISKSTTLDSVSIRADTNYIKLYAAKPGGSATQLQYNSGGTTFGGMTTTYDGTSVIFPTLTNAPSWRLGEMEAEAITGNNIVLTYNAYFNGGWVRRIADAVSVQSLTNGNVVFYQAPTGSIGSTAGIVPIFSMINGANTVFYGNDRTTASVQILGNTVFPNIPLALHNGTTPTSSVAFGLNTSGQLTLTPTGSLITVAGLLKYDINRGSTYDVRTVTDKRYVDSSIAANVAAVGGYIFQQSLTNNSGTVNLVGDVTTPASSSYYGTNGSGTRGFFTLPATPGIQAVLTANNALSTSMNLNMNSFNLTMFNGVFGIQHPTQSKTVLYNSAGVSKWEYGRSSTNTDAQDFYIKDVAVNAVRFSIDATGRVTVTSFTVIDGTQGAGKVMTSDAFGNTSWQTPPAQVIPTLEQVLNQNPALSTAHTISTSAGPLGFTSTGSTVLSIFSANKAMIEFQSASAGPGFLIGRSINNNNANDFFIYDNVNAQVRLGISPTGIVSMPVGLTTAAIQMPTGAVANDIMVSDASGNASWSNANLSTAGTGLTNNSSVNVAVSGLTLVAAQGYRTGAWKRLIYSGNVNSITVTSGPSSFIVNIALPTAIPANGSLTSGTFIGSGSFYSSSGFQFPASVVYLNSTTVNMYVNLPNGTYGADQWSVTFDYQ